MIEQQSQYVHCEIMIVGHLEPIFISFVYGCNTGVERRDLWRNIGKFSAFVQRKAWVVMGDFNSMLFPHDGLGGSSRRNSDMEEFHLCLEEAELFDISYQGCQFTWIQKPSGGNGIMRKLDRILGNSAFIAQFGDASVFFEPRGISNHSPGILSFKVGRRIRQCGFKFDNFNTSHVDFLKSVEGVWIKPLRGSYMKIVIRKLQEMKGVCRRLKNSYGCLDNRVAQLKTELDVAQLACDLDPFNDLLKEDIAHLLFAYQKARNDQEDMVRQKAKISWLNEGDGNSNFFFHVMKEKRNRSHIATIRDSFGTVFEHQDVPKAFINHFEGILGTSNMLVPPSMVDCSFAHSLSLSESLHLIRPISDMEIKDALFDIGNDKAPRPDGFSSKFFKAAWSVVGKVLTFSLGFIILSILELWNIS
ncbi:uncharacterized protein LOC112502927 [Cynara cardunculus var. scolymus]|uniref:uncharacterized protein LOC112502927 n=1 Tax=Cynara cardunculus var. scolymus TaxID=59895 RepID=UPI000D627BE7|nr:uncharacterized protein LOC112502927 [Cynara cardunculus var. scolymus]